MKFKVTKEWIETVSRIEPDVEIGAGYSPQNDDEMKHFIALKVWQRLNDGTGRAVSDDGCMYINEDGNKCAVGIFMKDDNPANTYIGNLWDLIRNFESDVPDFFKKFAQILAHFQIVHDNKHRWSGNTFVGQDKFKYYCDLNDIDHRLICKVKA